MRLRVARMLRRAQRGIADVAEVLEDAAGLNRVEKRTDFSTCERPVLLLYGLLSTRRTLDVLERRLRRDGYGVFSLNLGGLWRILNTRGIDDLADLVRAKIERIYARNPAMGPLTIVGHSKGGLIACYYVKKLGGWRRTRAVLTLAAPHHGTPLAYLGLPASPMVRSLWQLLPGSPFLRRLRDGAWPAQVRLVSIWSKRDPWAVYPSGVIETHGLPHLANVEVDAEHSEFLTGKRVYQVIRAEMATAHREAPVQRGPLTVMRGGRPAPPAELPSGKADSATG
ncbi:MAG TPA: alpha/beta hydrolase [Anaeromyxobacteraceae bacterium]|nr:alpha/beta hydrolase [Anaeromyxobacteraceae bacterium]